MRKPLHKHIGHHAKRISGHFTKYLYERDTIFATAWVFIFILAVKFFPIHNLHFFDPIEIAFEDFDMNDIAYSKLGKSEDTKTDNRIVIINIGESDREGLATIINKTASMGPKVIGLDVEMDGPRDPHKDSLMKQAVDANKNLVMATRFFPGKGKEESTYSLNYFSTPATNDGYVNFMTEDWSTIRIWNPFMTIEKKDSSKTYPSFVASIIKGYDPAIFEKLKKRKSKTEIINYTRNYTDMKKQYQVVEWQNLLDGRVDTAAIKGKIALLGYIDLNPENIEDKKFTPMNEKFAGKSIPDMNGIVVHANIISMVLDNNYIKKLPLWVALVVAILIGWLHMSFFIRYYLENHTWFHLVAKTAQLISAILFVYLGIHLFTRYRINLNMSLTLVVIVLAVDIIYFYEAFAVWMHKKWGFKTVFHQKHH